MLDQYESLGISAEEFDTLRKAFNIYDSENKGYITVKQFTIILKSLNIASDPKHLQTIIETVDLNGDNKIDFNEFVYAMFRYLPHGHDTLQCINCFCDTHTLEENNDDEELMACFQFFDKDKDGRISQAELEEVLIRIGAKLSPREIKEMMKTADTNRDGFIDFDEFKQLLPPL